MPSGAARRVTCVTIDVPNLIGPANVFGADELSYSLATAIVRLDQDSTVSNLKFFWHAVGLTRWNVLRHTDAARLRPIKHCMASLLLLICRYEHIHSLCKAVSRRRWGMLCHFERFGMVGPSFGRTGALADGIENSRADMSQFQIRHDGALGT